ncbi:MAG: hypothetical protein ACFB0C_03765 [Leptolyngbyaceae cyanobacterium]
MFAPVCLIPSAISELFAQVTQTRQITLADRFGLMAAAFDDSLTSEERDAVNRVLQGVRRGRFQVVDALSTLA